jgi:tetratricopeptide (TPR) repeat protein
MKKVLTLLNLFLLFTLVTLTLYIFNIIDIPFLHPGEERVKVAVKPTSQVENTAEKVERKKTFNELMAKANVYYENHLYNLAIDTYTKASNENSTSVEPLLKISEIQLILNEYEQAKNMCLKILQKDPHSVSAKIMLGQAYLGLADFVTAKSILDSIVSDVQIVQYHQGIVALFYGEYERGRGLLAAAASSDASRSTQQYAQKFIDALNEFDRFQAGQHTHLKVLLAKNYVQIDQPNMAKELLWGVVKENRNYRDAWIILGYSYLKLNQFEEAVDALEEAKNQDPEKPETLFFLGLAYASNNQLDEAIEVLNTAAQNGYQPRVHVEQKLAELYYQKKEYEKASNKYEEVISLNAGDLNYFVRPIWIYIDALQKPDKAVLLAQKALLNHPNKAMSYNLLGWAQVANDDFISAKKNLERAMQLDTNMDAPYLNYGWLYEKQGQYDKAMRFYKQAYELGGNGAVSKLAAEKYNILINKNAGIMANIFN